MKKILCLHGAFANASNFQIQLGPFVDAVEKLGSVELKWINGGHVATPPPGFENYFGAPPLYRFIDFEGVSEFDDMLSKIRDIPKGLTAEDSMRRLVANQTSFRAEVVEATLERLFKIIDEDPEIDGILGYSEGAMVASSLILEERRRCAKSGKPRRIQHAIFFGGWPPVRPAGESVEFLLSDECDEVIDVPTFHIIGCNDPYIHGALSLFDMCDQSSATLFDHGKGHTVPRDARTIEELAEEMQFVWNREGITA